MPHYIHGTLEGYRDGGCRCEHCTRANTEAHAQYMAANPEQREKKRQNARKGKPRRGPVHGAQSGLNWHKTHKVPLCEPCLAFKAAKRVLTKAKMSEKLIPCGTSAAIRRHYRHHEPIDEVCRVAFNLAERKRRKKK